MELKYKNKKYEIETTAGNDNSASMLLNKEKFDFNFRKIDSNCISLELNGKNVPAYFGESDNHVFVCVDGEYFTFDKVKDEEKHYGTEDSANADREVIYPPMPGSIVKILVEKGQKVKEGDGLIIIEAMKMETTLYSTIEGIVKEINVKQGEQADSDKVLVVIEKE